MKKERKLIVGDQYWIFDGQMRPFKAELSHIVNHGRTAIFGGIEVLLYPNTRNEEMRKKTEVIRGIPRKITSVYDSKEHAIKQNIY